MLKIYGADLSSPCIKVRLVANALKVPYEYVRVSIRDGDTKKDWFKMLTPVGKIPVIDDDGFVLIESNAIVKYLANKERSELYPQDLKRRALVDQWMDFVSIHVGHALGSVVYNRLFVGFAGGTPDQKAIEQGLGFLDRFFPVVDQQLAKTKCLMGEAMTLADISLIATLEPVEAAKIDVSRYPHIGRIRKEIMSSAFYKQCHNSYAEGLEKFMARKHSMTTTYRKSCPQRSIIRKCSRKVVSMVR